ncbi:MAG: phosphatidate cytidylyltransferase [Candidatus Obscuribacterales bacterium]|nr:phosphatidate cytidylyltransferase [Steroidobacteraceae bacterium]
MLRQRILTAVILGPMLLWLVLWAPPLATLAVIAGAILVGAWEWSRFCGLETLRTRIRYVLLLAAMMALAWRYFGDARVLNAVLVVALIWWLVALVWLAVAPQRKHVLLAALAGIAVLIPTWVALSHLHRAQQGPQLVLFVLLLVFAADIGAYFAGRAFGRLKLAPLVSPGKTWEGVLGGLCGAALIAIAGAFWFKFETSAFLALCSAVAAVSVVGDLTESMFKRHVGLKDSGAILPGHGGILDRIDSITAAAPIFALGMLWFKVLP